MQGRVNGSFVANHELATDFDIMLEKLYKWRTESYQEKSDLVEVITKVSLIRENGGSRESHREMSNT